MKRYWLILVLLALGGCTTTRIVHRPVPLPLPARPVLPAVAGSSLKCLSDATYTRLVERYRKLHAGYVKLERIIEVNNQHAKGKP